MFSPLDKDMRVNLYSTLDLAAGHFMTLGLLIREADKAKKRGLEECDYLYGVDLLFRQTMEWQSLYLYYLSSSDLGDLVILLN